MFWQETLGVSSVELCGKFLTEGGTSLLAVHLVEILEQQVGLTCPHLLAVILDGTLGEVISVIEEAWDLRQKQDGTLDGTLREVISVIEEAQGMSQRQDGHSDLNEAEDVVIRTDTTDSEYSMHRIRKRKYKPTDSMPDATDCKQVKPDPHKMCDMPILEVKPDTHQLSAEAYGVSTLEAKPDTHQPSVACEVSTLEAKPDTHQPSVTCEVSVLEAPFCVECHGLQTGEVVSLRRASHTLLHTARSATVVDHPVGICPSAVARVTVHRVWRYNTYKCVDASPLITTQR